MLAQVINFAIVFGVIYFFAMKPLKKLMNERSSKIAGGIEDAKVNKELLDKTKREYDLVLAQARNEASEIFKAGKLEAEANKKAIIDRASTEVEGMITSGKRALEAEKTKMLEEAKHEIVSLVVKATEKLLESEVDEKYDEKVLKEIKQM